MKPKKLNKTESFITSKMNWSGKYKIQWSGQLLYAGIICLQSVCLLGNQVARAEAGTWHGLGYTHTLDPAREGSHNTSHLYDAEYSRWIVDTGVLIFRDSRELFIILLLNKISSDIHTNMGLTLTTPGPGTDGLTKTDIIKMTNWLLTGYLIGRTKFWKQGK